MILQGFFRVGCVYPVKWGGEIGGELPWLISRDAGGGGAAFPCPPRGWFGGIPVGGNGKSVRPNNFPVDCDLGRLCIGSHECDEDTVVLEEGFDGVSRTDEPGADGIPAGAGMV